MSISFVLTGELFCEKAIDIIRKLCLLSLRNSKHSLPKEPGMPRQAIEILDPSVLAADIKPAEPLGFARGRHSLDHSVWYNGSLLTFLATAKDTQGQFALMEIVGRKGNIPPPHIHHREDENLLLA